jgi:hypothetical protein
VAAGKEMLMPVFPETRIIIVKDKVSKCFTELREKIRRDLIKRRKSQALGTKALTIVIVV